MTSASHHQRQLCPPPNQEALESRAGLASPTEHKARRSKQIPPVRRDMHLGRRADACPSLGQSSTRHHERAHRNLFPIPLQS
eukprot:CAMPEP_0169209554 /NCGR_PEP_ID=MMETSP1016-20121227/14730_1 /TAXON_ID=342587 /ORGANISM="Karlodinium micrum, Strain CCMP2283" /LENGTH=81 /DNA_ID=CAMNT_0009287009 /DNA_START=584 /DNA_END=829 /DNA_ORIENTATION=+